MRLDLLFDLVGHRALGLTERVSMWGVAGLSSGELTLSPGARRPIETEISMCMGALGTKGRVLFGAQV